jgi:hypothetical protein
MDETTDTEHYGANDVTPRERESWEAETDPEFKLTETHFNSALQAAGIQGLSVAPTPEGLHLDSGELEYIEVVDRLLNGLVSLWAKTLEQR